MVSSAAPAISPAARECGALLAFGGVIERIEMQIMRPSPAMSPLTPFIDEAGRMRAYVPPFRFTSFFSPEDTLLCTIAAEAALARARTMRRLNGRALDPLRIAELTTGSGLVGLHLLRLEKGSRLIGLDV